MLKLDKQTKVCYYIGPRKKELNLKQLYENAKSFILNNYNGNVDDKTLDILTVSIMSLYIRFPEVTRDKLPSILNKLEIFFDNKSILQMVSEKYPEYPTNEITDSTKAFVVRALCLEDLENIDEEWTMYISSSDITNGITNIIAKCTHELIHLLRFNGIVNGEKEIKVRDGVSIARCNKETRLIKRKYQNLEEGIVEDFTIKALIALYDFIRNEDVSFSSSLSLFKKKFEIEFKPSYELERFFLDGLNKNKKFSELLEYSFVDENEPITLITYYNDILDNSSAFAMLSRTLDIIIEYAEKNDTDNFKIKTNQLINEINIFLRKANVKSRK